MTNETKSPFVVGAEVVIVTSGWSGRHLGPRRKIAKVHKTGRFLLEGSDRQYTPDSYPMRDGRWFAHRSGRDHYRHEHIELWNDEFHTNEIARELRQKTANKVVSNLEDWLRGRRCGNGNYSLTDRQFVALQTFLGTVKADDDKRRLSEIEDELARPNLEGKEWDQRRSELEAERERLVQAK